MRVALAQINSFLGGFEANAGKIISYISKAHNRHCDLVVFPEAALFGYYPMDLLERPSLVAEQEKWIRVIHRSIPNGVAVLVGAFVRNTSKRGKPFWNAAVLLEKGKKARIFAKELLPSYDVFDESRHIQPGQLAKNIFRHKGKRILITICEDIWGWERRNTPGYSRYSHNPIRALRPGSVDFAINLSASPFTQSKLANRRIVTRLTAIHLRCPLIYVNMVGAQDELIYDGGSFALNEKGRVFAQCVRFEEELGVVDLEKREGVVSKLSDNPQEILRSALVLGLREFVHKTGFRTVHLGLSGGIDSALVACIAADALGPMNVTALYLPGPFSARESGEWSKQLAEHLGIRFAEIPITGAYEQVLKDFETVLGPREFGLTNENMQARLRGLTLMSFSNREGSLLIGTSNKSEFAVGYSTLYGDMIGGLMPIGDLLKTEVFELARYYNSQSELIPKGILERPPSAELRANQRDQDSLPPYEDLDRVVERLVLGFHAPKSDLERRVFDMMLKSEFKRWQSPPILKVSDHAFGRGRRFPVAHGARG